MDTLIDFIAAHTSLTCLSGALLCGFVAACLSEQTLRQDVLAALQKAGWTILAAATQIGMSRQRLGHQLDGTDPLTCLSRLLTQLEGFASAFTEISATHQSFVLVTNTDLADILANLKGNKVMARMEWAEKKEQTA